MSACVCILAGLVLPSAHIRQLEALVEEACGGDGEERERKARFLRFVEGRRRQVTRAVEGRWGWYASVAHA